MRKLVIPVVALLVLSAGLTWSRAHGVATSSAGASATSTTSTVTTTTLPVPQPVCFNEIKPASAGHAATPIDVCRPWQAKDVWSGSTPSIYTLSFPPHDADPSVVAYAAWFRSSSTDLGLYLGYEGPGPSTLSRGPEMVPPQGRSRLLVTFNSGFYEKDAREGFYVNHTLYYPMVYGQATVVRFSNGRVDIIRWTGGPRPGANIVMARQNLPLLVNVGVATPLSANNSAWGVTLGGIPAVWRSALGIDANGNLVYVAAPAQTSSSLAALMVRLHVVRAMQLDINPAWPVLVTYGGAGARGASLFVANVNQSATRFLTPSQKDFFALYLSRSPGEAEPW